MEKSIDIGITKMRLPNRQSLHFDKVYKFNDPNSMTQEYSQVEENEWNELGENSTIMQTKNGWNSHSISVYRKIRQFWETIFLVIFFLKR